MLKTLELNFIYLFIYLKYSLLSCCSSDRWWRGTDPTVSTLKKALSLTCAPSWSATVTASTVKFLLFPSPPPGENTTAVKGRIVFND